MDVQRKIGNWEYALGQPTLSSVQHCLLRPEVDSPFDPPAVFQIVGHKPFKGHKTNAVHYNEHFFLNRTRRELKIT